MTKNQQFIYESIYNQVRMGFESIEDIKEKVLEEVEDNEFKISEKWVNETIEDEYQKLEAESKTWTFPTDTQKLILAFHELCDQNIIALHNAGYTNSDGESEVVEVEWALRDKNIKSDGYCFYHSQGLETAINDNILWIAFQKIDNEDDAITIEVGKKVAAKLKEHGFEVIWNESPTQKIEIKNFNWRNIFIETSSEYLLNYENVVERMLKNKS